MPWGVVGDLKPLLLFFELSLIEFIQIKHHSVDRIHLRMCNVDDIDDIVRFGG